MCNANHSIWRKHRRICKATLIDPTSHLCALKYDIAFQVNRGMRLTVSQLRNIDRSIIWLNLLHLCLILFSVFWTSGVRAHRRSHESNRCPHYFIISRVRIDCFHVFRFLIIVPVDRSTKNWSMQCKICHYMPSAFGLSLYCEIFGQISIAYLSLACEI